MNFFDPALSHEGKPYRHQRYKEVVNEGYIISKHTHTSYTDIYQMTPTEREAIVRCIIADFQKIQQLKDQIDQNKG